MQKAGGSNSNGSDHQEDYNFSEEKKEISPRIIARSTPCRRGKEEKNKKNVRFNQSRWIMDNISVGVCSSPEDSAAPSCCAEFHSRYQAVLFLMLFLVLILVLILV